jgi:hypothetical protein
MKAGYAPEKIEYGVNRYVNETRRLYRLADPAVRLMSTTARDQWLRRVPTSVLRAAGDPSPAELTITVSMATSATRSPACVAALRHAFTASVSALSG